MQLIIALSTEVRRKASGQRIVCQAFHVIRRPDVSKDTLRYFRCQQSFHHAARLIAACRTIIPSPFIGIGLIVNSAMIHTIIENTITIGDFIRLIAAKLIINRRRFDSLCGIDYMLAYCRIVAFVLPIPGLLIEQRSQIEQPLAGFRVCGIIYLVIKPENTFEIVSPAGVAPIAEGPVGKFFCLITVVFFKERQYPLIRIPLVNGSLIIIAHSHQGRHTGPPISQAAGGAKSAGLRLAA